MCVNRKHKLFTSQEEQELRRGIRYLQAHACSHVPSASERSARRAVREQEQLLRRKLALQEGEGEGDEEGEEDDGAELWGARKPAYYGEGVEVRGPASAAVPQPALRVVALARPASAVLTLPPTAQCGPALRRCICAL